MPTEEPSLEEYWDDLRRKPEPRPEPEPINPEPFFPSTINVEEDPLLTIRGAEDRMMVEIHSDGTLRFGEGYTPNEAARIFWEAIAHFPRG